MSAAKKLFEYIEDTQLLKEVDYNQLALFAIVETEQRVLTVLDHSSNVEAALKQFIAMLNADAIHSVMTVKYLCPESIEEIVKRSLAQTGFSFAGKALKTEERVDFIVNPSKGKVLVKFKKNQLVSRAAAHKTSSQLEEKVLSGSAGPLKLLVVDDSSTIRKVIARAMAPYKDKVVIVADTGNPAEVADLIEREKPDLMTLDINMEVMNGDVLLQKIFPQYFVPTLVLSSLGLTEGKRVINALEAGAVDYMQKPETNDMSHFGADLLSKFENIKGIKHKKRAEKVSRLAGGRIEENSLWAIGASTGGTEAIKNVLDKFPDEVPPTVIAIHMPPYFSKAFADRLNSSTPFLVKEAEDGEVLEKNKVLVAPGGFHMIIVKKADGQLYTKMKESHISSEHKPSVDQLFESLAVLDKYKVRACLLTGMGKDGAQGLLKLKGCGAWTMGQDEETSVVYGMPKAAFAIGATCEVRSIFDMAEGFVKKL